MFNVHAALVKYYDDYVRLGGERRAELAASRDACLDRLRAGLKKLGRRGWADRLDQGSYAMHTLNQHPDKDYDIDVAVIFEEGDLPAGAFDARKLVEAALLEAGGNFKRAPSARTNAVTVWYADGYHVDLAVYRRTTNWLGSEVLEHGGGTWRKRDPAEVTKWFDRRVASLSPSGWGVTVQDQQFRRVVRLVKAFARSRKAWKDQLPGGMIISVLLSEVFVSDDERDDVSLRKSMKALKKRIDRSKQVLSPVDQSDLTAKPAIAKQVERLGEKLDDALVELDILDDERCTEKDALAAWQYVFRHSYWGELKADADAEPAPDDDAGVQQLQFEVGVCANEGGAVQRKYSGPAETLEKGKWLRMEPRNFPVPRGARIRWTVRNTGDEARSDGQERWSRSTDGEMWTPTKYRGIHSVSCEVVSGGKVIARGLRRVRIGSR